MFDSIKELEHHLSELILFIGDELPQALIEDKRPKFVMLGTPQELIDIITESAWLRGYRLGKKKSN